MYRSIQWLWLITKYSDLNVRVSESGRPEDIIEAMSSMQLLVDLAQTLKESRNIENSDHNSDPYRFWRILNFDSCFVGQDVAEAHGLTSQALRSAQIAETAARSGAPGAPVEKSPPPSGAPGALHVSLQELYELKTLRVKLFEAMGVPWST